MSRSVLNAILAALLAFLVYLQSAEAFNLLAYAGAALAGLNALLSRVEVFSGLANTIITVGATLGVLALQALLDAGGEVTRAAVMTFLVGVINFAMIFAESLPLQPSRTDRSHSLRRALWGVR